MTKRTDDFNRFISDHVNLNPSRYERLNSGVRGVSEYLSQHLDGYLKVERQGSHALRTITKPVNDHEYDVDLLLFMDYDSSKTPKDYIEEVYHCLKLNQTYAGKVRRKKRCVVVDYAGDFHLDVVPCITYGSEQYICNRATDKFEATDGTGFRDWFNQKNRITNGNLKLVTRLLKHLRDHKQTFTAPSILLTTLIGGAVHEGEGDSHFRTVPDTLLTVCNRINDFLQSNPVMPVIVNPALPEEEFTRHWDQTKYSHFRKTFNRYTTQMNEAYRERDHQASVRQWRGLFDDSFGRIRSEARSIAATAPTRVVTPRKPYAR